jgi:L-fuconolactonase
MTEIFDIHPHIVSTDTARYPVAPLLGKRSDWSHGRAIDLDTLIAAMDEAGVAKAAIVHSSTTYGFDNSYVADAVAAHPGRFAGVFSSDVTADDAADKVAYWVGRGLSGLRIFSKGSTIARQWLSLDDPGIFPALEKADSLGISVCINVHATEDELPQVHAVLNRYPTLRLVLDHLGRVKIKDGAPYDKARPLFEMAKYPNFYLKLTPRLLEDVNAEGSMATADTILPRLVQEFGANRIAFGSNFPSSPGTMTELVSAMVEALQCLGQADRQMILSGTAKALYPALARV